MMRFKMPNAAYSIRYAQSEKKTGVKTCISLISFNYTTMKYLKLFLIINLLLVSIICKSQISKFFSGSLGLDVEQIDIKELHTPDGKTINDFSIPEKLLANDKELVKFIMESESMDNKERQYWFNLVEAMDKDKIEKLRDILVRERKKMAEIDKKYSNQNQNEKPQSIASNKTTFIPSFLTKRQKEYLEMKIFDLTGLKVDVSHTNQEYLNFINPDRYLQDSEITGGFMRFPQKTTEMKLGQILSEFVVKFKSTCKNQKNCKIASTNTFYAILAANSLAASKSMSGSKQLEILRVGLFISELYKSDVRNQCTSLYGGMIGVLDASINEIINDRSNYSAYHNPTVDFVLSCSKAETAAILVGLVGIGTSIALSWGRQISKNLDYTDLSTYPNTNVSISNDLSQKDQVKSYHNISLKKVEYITDDSEILVGKTSIYYAYLSNGGKVKIKKYHQSGSWVFANDWGEANRGNKYYKNQQDILNALIEKENR